MKDEELQSTIEEIFAESERLQEQLRWLSANPEVFRDSRHEYSRTVGQMRDYLAGALRQLIALRNRVGEE